MGPDTLSFMEDTPNIDLYLCNLFNLWNPTLNMNYGYKAKVNMFLFINGKFAKISIWGFNVTGASTHYFDIVDDRNSNIWAYAIFFRESIS